MRVAKVALQLTEDGRDRERGERGAALRVVAVDRFDEADTYLEESLRIQEPDSLFLRFAAINKVLVQYFGGKPYRAYKTLLRVQGSLGPSWLRGFPVSNQMSVLWTEGQILNTIGLHDQAVGRLKEARDFYIHLVPEFEPSPTDQLHLVLLMKDIRRTLRG